MKTQTILLRIAGIISFIFVIFHLMFEKAFNWPITLNCLLPVNKAIMLTYHYICILVLIFMSIVSVFQTKTLINSDLKYSVLGFFCFFFIIRIITEFTFFGIRSSSIAIIPMCAIPAIIFAIPLIKNKKNEE